MSLKLLKTLTSLVYVFAALEVVCLGGTIYTAVQKHRVEVQSTPTTIPTPAGIPVPANPGQPVPQFH
jgi:hypothetical protein